MRARALLFWRSDSLEHGLNISETPRSCALQRAPVRWTLTLKTNHLWSLGPCQCRNTTEQRLQSRAELSRWRHAAEVPRRSTNRPRDTRNKELNSRGKTKPKSNRLLKTTKASIISISDWTGKYDLNAVTKHTYLFVIFAGWLSYETGNNVIISTLTSKLSYVCVCLCFY